MAFFGVTKLGYQDSIREHVRDPPVTPISAFRSGQYRDPNFTLPKIDRRGASQDVARSRDTPNAVTPFTGQTAAYGYGPCSSNEELQRMKHKYIVNPTGAYSCAVVYRTTVVFYRVMCVKRTNGLLERTKNVYL